MLRRGEGRRREGEGGGRSPRSRVERRRREMTMRHRYPQTHDGVTETAVRRPITRITLTSWNEDDDVSMSSPVLRSHYSTCAWTGNGNGRDGWFMSKYLLQSNSLATLGTADTRCDRIGRRQDELTKQTDADRTGQCSDAGRTITHQRSRDLAWVGDSASSHCTALGVSAAPINKN